MLEEVKEKGVIFLDIDSGLREYPEIFRKYFDTVIPYNDNKFSALNGAVWSGGSFIYVPPGVKLEKPLQSYFRINSERMALSLIHIYSFLIVSLSVVVHFKI